MALSVGQRLTLLRIDNMLAWTHRYELEVRQVLEPRTIDNGEHRQRVAVVRQRGKRKQSYLDVAHDDIVLDGWDVPFRADSECSGVICGNACFNLVGDPAIIRDWIEKRAAFPASDDAKARIIVYREVQTTSEVDGELLYPEIDTHSAVINAMKE